MSTTIVIHLLRCYKRRNDFADEPMLNADCKISKQKDLDSQIKSLVLNVLQYVKNLRDFNFLQTVEFKNSQEVISKMCGVIVLFDQRCIQEQKEQQGLKNLSLLHEK